jgi:hypothetical protein
MASSMSLKSFFNCVFKEHSSQLTMCERKGPKSEIGSSIGDSTENELDCFNQLVNNKITKWRVMMRLIFRFSAHQVF